VARSRLGCALELEPGEPIHGRLQDSDGVVHGFRGWLELCGAIERARREASESLPVLDAIGSVDHALERVRE
jgi:hypothetical protein